MARDYAQRLQRLRARRTGADQAGITIAERLQRELKEEGYLRRADVDVVKYALGAMEKVDADYTRVSIEQAERVGRQLEAGLQTAGTSASYRLQGSVPLDVHIRGSSDVDLLAIIESAVTYDPSGRGALSGRYTSPYHGDLVADLMLMRSRSEKILTASYPAADVDVSGDKSIKISGGSLQRAVDVVPGHWHDSTAYQINYTETFREIYVLDKSGPRTLKNSPFYFMSRINERDIMSAGGLKKAVRLLKNIKFDLDPKLAISSYDLASLMWHCKPELLQQSALQDLTVVASTSDFLNEITSNISFAQTLETPDGSRRILNEQRKVDGLVRLNNELNVVAEDLARSVATYLLLEQKVEKSSIRKALKEHRIKAA